MATVAERLRGLREGIHISQQKLSVIIGSSQSNINRYEHGQAEAPYKILLWYADYFDVSLDYIFGRTDSPQGTPCSDQPDILKDKTAQGDEWNEFIEACFEPRSPMNAKLKEMLLMMAEEGNLDDDTENNCG